MVSAVTLRVAETLSVALAVTVLGCGQVEGGSPAEGGSGGNTTAGGTDALGGASSALGGAGGSSIAGAGSAGIGDGGARLTGTWSMFAFEDPVMVRISQDGQTLSGFGCCAGFRADAMACCGEVTGTVEGSRATFSFHVREFERTYRTSVVLSEDGERMGGYFGFDDPLDWKVAWVKSPNDETWLPPDPSLEEFLSSKQPHYRLWFVSPHTGRFSSDRGYDVYLDVFAGVALVHGEFGPFYSGEMAVDSARQVLRAGPVPATDPALAESLELEFSGSRLVSVIATYADDDQPYVFAVGPFER